MTLSYNLAYQEIILVHPTRRQIFAGKSVSTFWNIWEWVIFRIDNQKKLIHWLIDVIQSIGTFEHDWFTKLKHPCMLRSQVDQLTKLRKMKFVRRKRPGREGVGGWPAEINLSSICQQLVLGRALSTSWKLPLDDLTTFKTKAAAPIFSPNFAPMTPIFSHPISY